MDIFDPRAVCGRQAADAATGSPSNDRVALGEADRAVPEKRKPTVWQVGAFIRRNDDGALSGAGVRAFQIKAMRPNRTPKAAPANRSEG